MNEENAIVKFEQSGEIQRADLMPAMSMQMAVERYNTIVGFVRTVMKKDRDFGEIPGTNKPTLLKAGAEKLSTLFGLVPRFEEVRITEDWDKGFFYYCYRCVLERKGIAVASCIGSCNTKEKKYRYRTAEKKCPQCNKPTIIKGRSEYGGGWICFAKKGGCGAKFSDNDKLIESQASGMIENTEPFDLINTVQKMAQKRAFVGAALIATNASEFFTQDVEDMDFVDAEFTVLPRTTVQDQAVRESQIGEDEQFEGEVADALAADGFTPVEAINLLNATLRKHGKTLAQADQQWRLAFLSACREHKFRGLKTHNAGDEPADVPQAAGGPSSDVSEASAPASPAVSKPEPRKFKGWDEFAEAAWELADGQGISDETFGAAIEKHLLIIGKKNRKDDVTKIHLAEWYEAIRTNCFDWSNGRINEAGMALANA